VTFVRRTWAVVWKDVLVERRSKETVNAVLFFSVLLLFVFEFTLGADRERLTAVLPGLLWLGVLLAGLLGLGRSSARTTAGRRCSSPRATRALSTSASSSAISC
jgi:heme exporter protein B